MDVSLLSADSPAIACAQLAMQRASATTRLELNRGFNGLASVESLAALLGLWLTVRGIVFSFKGTTGPKSAILAALAYELSHALIPAAAGLAIAIFAYALRRHLRTQVESLTLDMDLASSALLACLRPLEKLAGAASQAAGGRSGRPE